MLMNSLFIPFTFLNFILMFSSHPISKSLILIFLVLIYSIILYFVNLNSWYSFIVFMAFVGGILIMFIYIISLLENEILIKINFNKKNIMYLMFISIFLTSYVNYFNTSILLSNLEPWQKKFYFLYFIFSKSYFKCSLLLILYLFLSMISMLKIINNKKINY